MLQETGFVKLDCAEVGYSGFMVDHASDSLLGKKVVNSIQQWNQKCEEAWYAEIESFSS